MIKIYLVLLIVFIVLSVVVITFYNELNYYQYYQIGVCSVIDHQRVNIHRDINYRVKYNNHLQLGLISNCWYQLNPIDIYWRLDKYQELQDKRKILPVMVVCWILDIFVLLSLNILKLCKYCHDTRPRNNVQAINLDAIREQLEFEGF